MDLIRTLGVAIDPSAAKTGGAAAASAFSGVGKSAREMEGAAGRAANVLKQTGAEMKASSSAGQMLRDTLTQQTRVLETLSGAVSELTAILKASSTAAVLAAAAESKLSAAASVASASITSTTTAAAAASTSYLAIVATADRASESVRRLSAQARAMKSIGSGPTITQQPGWIVPASSSAMSAMGATTSTREMINVTNSARQLLLLENGARASESAMQRLMNAFWSANTAITSGSKSIAGFVSEINVMGTAIAGAGLVMFARDLIDTEIKVQGAANALRYASGTAQEFAKNQQFVRQVSNALGLDLLQTSADFSQLAAAAKGTKLEGAGARDILLATAKASAALHLSSAQTSQIITAFYQMLGKGTVQAQEFKLQLGNALPVAMQLASRATGLTVAELGKMMDAGELLASDFLPKFAAEMDRSFSADAAKNVNSVSAEVNRLSTAWMDFKSELMNGAIGDILIWSLGKLRDILKEIQPLVQGVGGELKAFGYWADPNKDPKFQDYVTRRLNQRGVIPSSTTASSNQITIPNVEGPSADALAAARRDQVVTETRARGLDLLASSQSQYADQVARTWNEMSRVKDLGLSLDASKVFIFDKGKIDEASQSLGGLEAASKTVADVEKALNLVFSDIDAASQQNMQQLAAVNDQLDAFFDDLDRKSATMLDQRVGRGGYTPKQTATGSNLKDMGASMKTAAEDLTNMFEQAKAAGQDMVSSVSSGFTGFFDDIIEGTDNVGKSFTKMTASILRDIAKIVAQRMIAEPIAGAIMSGVGAIFSAGVGSAVGASSATAGFGDGITLNPSVGYAHTGGVIGSTILSTKLVDPSIFNHAPRFHNGLKPDEFPAVLQRGEEVVPANRAGRDGVTVSMPITVNVDGSKGGTPEQNKQLGEDIARQLEAMVDSRLVMALRPRGLLNRAGA